MIFLAMIGSVCLVVSVVTALVALFVFSPVSMQYVFSIAVAVWLLIGAIVLYRLLQSEMSPRRPMVTYEHCSHCS